MEAPSEVSSSAVVGMHCCMHPGDGRHAAMVHISIWCICQARNNLLTLRGHDRAERPVVIPTTWTLKNGHAGQCEDSNKIEAR
jgi:hypothetical protein